MDGKEVGKLEQQGTCSLGFGCEAVGPEESGPTGSWSNPGGRRGRLQLFPVELHPPASSSRHVREDALGVEIGVEQVGQGFYWLVWDRGHGLTKPAEGGGGGGV